MWRDFGTAEALGLGSQVTSHARNVTAGAAVACGWSLPPGSGSRSGVAAPRAAAAAVHGAHSLAVRRRAVGLQDSASCRTWPGGFGVPTPKFVELLAGTHTRRTVFSCEPQWVLDEQGTFPTCARDCPVRDRTAQRFPRCCGFVMPFNSLKGVQPIGLPQDHNHRSTFSQMAGGAACTADAHQPVQLHLLLLRTG